MAKRPSLTKTVAEAAFYQAWFANTPEQKHDPETYNRVYEQYLKRFSKMPALALRTVARAASAEANRSIEAYKGLTMAHQFHTFFGRRPEQIVS